jgi:hypothetical protein
MLIDTIGGHTIERYDSIDELPVDRFFKFNRFVMLDAGVGSDHADADKTDQKIIRLIRNGNYDEAVKAVQNRNTLSRWMMEQVNPKMMSYIPLIHSIDGKPFNDYSEDGCRRMLDKLGKWGATKSLLSRIIDLAKKKFQDEKGLMLPELTQDPATKELFSKRKQRVQLLLKKIINPEEEINELVERIDEFIYKMFTPEIYAGAQGVEARFVRSYQEMTFVMSQHSSADIKTMTAVEYLQGWNTLKAQMKAKAKGAKAKAQ